MNDKEENDLIYQTFQYLRYDKSIKLKYGMYRKIRQNKFDYLQETMANHLEIKDGKLVAKIGPGWSCINKTTMGLLAHSCVSTFIEKRRHISASHTKKYLLNDPVPNENYVFIGYDTRKDSREIACIFANVFYQNGYRVSMPDEPCLAPFVSYMANYSIYKCGVYISGYPNSKKYSGVRIYLEDGCLITNDFAAFINQKMADRKVVEYKRKFLIEKFDYDKYLLMYIKHFLTGTRNAIITMIKNLRFQKEKRVAVSCAYGPTAKILNLVKEYYGMQGIMCVFPPHAVADPNLGNKENIDDLEQFLEEDLVKYASFYESECILFLDNIGLKFRIAVKRFDCWKFLSVDDIVSYFSILYYENTRPLDTMVINDYDCTNLGAVLSMSYGFRYYRAGLNNYNTQDAYCKYVQGDNQINNYFVYNTNFEFVNYYGKEASAVHIAIITTVFLQYKLPDITITCTKYLFGVFHTKKILIDKYDVTDLIRRNIKVLPEAEVLRGDKDKLFELRVGNYVYIIFYEQKDTVEMRVFFNSLIFNDYEVYINKLLSKINLRKKEALRAGG